MRAQAPGEDPGKARRRYAALIRERARREQRKSYLAFCTDPGLFPGETPQRHHRLLCASLEGVERGEIKRLMVLMPPGRAKSTYCSVRFAPWYLGRNPKHYIIQGSHTAGLAARFGRKARNVLSAPEYREIFPEVWLSGDMQGRSDWALANGGEYFAIGVDGGVAGRRAHLLILDDLIKGRKDADSETVRQSTWEWYKSDARTRLLPGGAIIYVCTRWHEEDPAGRILPADYDGRTGWVTARDGEEWYVLNLPEVAERDDDPLGRKPGEVLWPEFYTPEMVERERIVQGSRNWNALFQQRPTTQEGAIIKREWWQLWPGKEPPHCSYILQSYDPAFTEEDEEDAENASDSARTTWGVFDLFHEANAAVLKRVIDEWSARGFKRKYMQRYHVILLERWNAKVGFPEFRREAVRAYREYQPDRVLVEKKASGASLIQELKRANIPVKPISPDTDKVSRAHSASISFEQRVVWHMRRAWAEEVISHCAKFPTGGSLDIVDTVTQAIIWFRKTYNLEFVADEYPDGPPPDKTKPNRGKEMARADAR